MKRKNESPAPESLGLATRAIHGRKLFAHEGPVATSIAQTSTYRFKDSEDAVRYAKGDPNVYVYTRYHNPTVREAEERLALILGTEKALLFSSGMAAITTAIFSLVRSGDEIISTPGLYGGTYRFFRDTLPRHGISVRYVPAHEVGTIARMITRATKLVYFETPTNPTLQLVDIAGIVKATRAGAGRTGSQVAVMIDNTFATSLNQDPLRAGVDVVVESGTKYLGGHSDLMAGVVGGTASFIKQVHGSLKHFGGCTDPLAAYLMLRSLKTFPLRGQRQNENALALAKHLSKHRNVLRVLYPGLPSHPDHKTAKKQMSGYGGMVTIEVRGGVKGAVTVCDSLQVAINAMSLGGVETLVSIPVYSSHINMTKEELGTHGVTPGMIRISVGIEDIADLKDDFDKALRKL